MKKKRRQTINSFNGAFFKRALRLVHGKILVYLKKSANHQFNQIN